MKSLTELAQTIERHLPEGGVWCDLEKAHRLAAMIVGLRPSVVVEIGVWQGGSLIPCALAAKYNVDQHRATTAKAIADGKPTPKPFTCKVIAIDPWSAQASIADEEPANVAWWGKQDHDAAFNTFVERVARHELSGIVMVWRQRSDDATPPRTIDLLHVDGSHTEQAVRDVGRFGRAVRIGGIMVLDDLDWSSGAVQRARDLALQLGFVELYKLGSGVVLQRADPE